MRVIDILIRFSLQKYITMSMSTLTLSSNLYGYGDREECRIFYIQYRVRYTSIINNNL